MTLQVSSGSIAKAGKILFFLQKQPLFLFIVRFGPSSTSEKITGLRCSFPMVVYYKGEIYFSFQIETCHPSRAYQNQVKIMACWNLEVPELGVEAVTWRDYSVLYLWWKELQIVRDGKVTSGILSCCSCLLFLSLST